MSGVFGWIQKEKPESLADQIKRMGDEIKHRSWQQVETWADLPSGVGMGRIGIGIFNQEHQPCFSYDQNIVLFFAGELFYNNFSKLLPDAPVEWACLPHPEHILKLYQAYGQEAFEKIEGLYILALFDRELNTIFISNDHYGAYPLHFSEGPYGLLFSPEYKAILNHPAFDKKLNLDSLAEYIRFQRLLGEKSFFENIRKLRRGSILSYDLNLHTLKIRQYWNYSHIPEIDIDFDQAADTLRSLLIDAVYRQTQGNLRKGVYMSGGVDSRTIATLASRFERPLHTITYGDPESKDYVLANKIARRINTEHHNFPLTNGHWLLDHIDDHLELTEGEHIWLHLHGISTIETMREHIDIQMNGFCGDHLLNVYARRGMELEEMKALEPICMTSMMFHHMTQRSSWPCVNEAEALVVFSEQIRTQMRDRAYASLATELDLYRGLPNVKMIDAFKFTNHTMGLTFNFNIFFRSGLEIRLPYLDYNYFNFVQSLSPDIRYMGGNKLCMEMLERTIPEVTGIINANDDMAPSTHRGKRLLSDLNLRLARLGRRISPEKFKERPSLAVNYEEYLRTDLKDWAEGILFDERTLDRGLFNPDFIKSIWKRHQSGELHTIGKFAPIISYEMVLRRFLDQEGNK